MSASSERRRSKRKKERLLPIPEHYQDHLQFVLWPREKVLYQERPRRAAIARRYPPFLALAVLSLWLLPLCGLLPASMMYYNGADWWITLLPLTLLPLDLVLLVALVWWWKQLEYCFVLTERRVMTFRHGMLGCSAELHMEERDIQDFADDRGFKLGKYADGSGSVEVPGFERVPYVSAIQKVEECALKALEGSPTYMAQDQRLLPILAWVRRIFVSLLVPALLLLLIPAIVSVALEAIHEQQESEEGSPDTALWWLPNILFTVLFGVAYALSVSASIAVTVWGTQYVMFLCSRSSSFWFSRAPVLFLSSRALQRGYKGTWILQSRSEHEMEAGTDMVREQSAEGVAVVGDEAPLSPEDLDYTVGDPIQDADDVFRD